jgi:hypothetical protein
MDRQTIIEATDEIKVLEYGLMSGFHYTSKYAARIIRAEGFLGCEWETEELVFSSNNPVLENGAVFAYPQENSAWYDANPDAECLKVSGYGYRVYHEVEMEEQIIFETDSLSIL